MQEIRTAAAPAPVGPYSQAVVANGVVYCSGQIPLDPATGEMVRGEIEAQTAQVFANLRAVLEAAGSSLEHVVRASVFLADLGMFPRMNAVYAEHFTGDPQPARSTVQAAALPLGAQVEIDCVAVVG